MLAECNVKLVGTHAPCAHCGVSHGELVGPNVCGQWVLEFEHEPGCAVTPGEVAPL